MTTTLLIFGDIVGKVGRRAVAAALPDLKARFSPDFILGNAENLSGGRGVNKRCFKEMMEMGFHGFTSGNHIWDNREVLAIIDQDDRLIRPANYPSPPLMPCPGRGFSVFRSGEKRLLAINLMGRVFMDSIDCPFQAVEKILQENPTEWPIWVDMHADATSEKNAMGWFLDGRVSAVTGTHSHVQTADERILPKGTAYLTDVGMSGAFDSVIGVRAEEVIKKFVSKRAHPYQQASENPGVSCAVIQINHQNKATAIERMRFSVSLDPQDLTEG